VLHLRIRQRAACHCRSRNRGVGPLQTLLHELLVDIKVLRQQAASHSCQRGRVTACVSLLAAGKLWVAISCAHQLHINNTAGNKPATSDKVCCRVSKAASVCAILLYAVAFTHHAQRRRNQSRPHDTCLMMHSTQMQKHQYTPG